MKKQILIVDDEKIQCLALQSRLQAEGYEVHIAERGEEALKTLEQNVVDVMLLNLRMPGMEGTEILKRVTQGYPKTDVIIMTGFADFMEAVDCLENGARDYLVKPIHPTELITRLNALYRERELRQTVQEVKNNFSPLALFSLLSTMNSIISIIDHIIKGRSGQTSKEQAYLLSYVRNLGDKTVGMMRRLSGLSRSDDGKSDQQYHKLTDIAALTESVFIRYDILARPKGLKMKRSISRPLPKVMCDPDSIIQAFNNILDYSFEHSLSEGTISISAIEQKDATDEKGNSRIIISIRDSGIGVPGEGLSHVLDDKNIQDGLINISPDLKITEIGLAVSKHIVKENGGKFDVKFDAGSGNTFVVTLPAAK